MKTRGTETRHGGGGVRRRRGFLPESVPLPSAFRRKSRRGGFGGQGILTLGGRTAARVKDLRPWEKGVRSLRAGEEGLKLWENTFMRLYFFLLYYRPAILCHEKGEKK